MRLLDSSTWIEYLRGTGSHAAEVVEELLQRPDEIATTEPVVMEILAGATDEAGLHALENLTSGLTTLPLDPRTDYHDAARIFRAARRRGLTVRRLTDCLVAAVALRHDVPVVHRDNDFEVIASVTTLRTESLLSSRRPG